MSIQATRSIDRMNNQRTSYGTEDKSYSVKQIYVYISTGLSCEINVTHTPIASGAYGRQAGRQTDEIRVDFEVLNPPQVKLFGFLLHLISMQ